MPVPAVSPHNWKRTKVTAHLCMGIPMSTVDALSFEDRLTQILDSTGNIVEETKEYRDYNTDSKYRYHDEFITSGEDVPYTVTVELDRDDAHRPRVEEDTIDELKTSIKCEKSKIPVDKLDFDDNLGVLLDIFEDYYETLQCRILVR